MALERLLGDSSSKRPTEINSIDVYGRVEGFFRDFFAILSGSVEQAEAVDVEKLGWIKWNWIIKVFYSPTELKLTFGFISRIIFGKIGNVGILWDCSELYRIG